MLLIFHSTHILIHRITQKRTRKKLYKKGNHFSNQVLTINNVFSPFAHFLIDLTILYHALKDEPVK